MTPMQQVNAFVLEAARLIELSDDLLAVLSTSYREVSVQVPVRLDGGGLGVYRGYRVQHNGARGPYKGGIRYHCRRWGLDLATRTVAVQGFGNVGSWVARELVDRGARVVAISDVSGGLHDERGLDVVALLERADRREPLAAAAGHLGDATSNEDLLGLDVDVLIPAALGGVLHEANARAVQASIIVEAANNPTTPEADKLLQEAGVRILPDVLANAGGVTGSYFEWAQDIQVFQWKEDRFNAELREVMERAFLQTATFADERNVSLRLAAFAIGMQRVAEASRLRGYV